MSFQVPLSSSPPPSTPDRRSSHNAFSFGASNNPSTTPAGPPPSSAASFTPQGPPPSSFLGSSMMSTQSPLKPLSFGQSSFSNKSSQFASTMRSPVEQKRSGLSNEYEPSPQRSFRAPSMGSDEGDGGEEYTEEDRRRYTYDEEDAEGMTDEDDQYEEDDDMTDFRSGSKRNEEEYDEHSESDLGLSPGGLRRTVEDDTMDLKNSLSQSVLEPQTSPFDKIAKDLYSRMPVPSVQEKDALVLDTEAIITRLYEEGIGTVDDETLLQEALATIPGELTRLWSDYYKQNLTIDSEEYSATIGPGPKATDFAKANFLAGLALQIHHPDFIQASFSRKQKPLPLVLLEWLDEQHNPYPTLLEEIATWRPSPSSHREFWGEIFNCLIRGKVIAVVSILKNAGWAHARNESDDPKDRSSDGFSGVALRNVQKVMDDAVKVLSQCPATSGDWNTRNSDWTLFRLRISQALEELKSFAEGRNRNLLESTSNGSGTYSRTAQKATSQVPWYIYQNMVTLYSLVMGDMSAIIENSQDWCEATIGLLVWWDEGKDQRRHAHGRSLNIYRASARESDEEAYMRKLRKSFESAISESTDFEVNSADEIEVGLASLFEGNNEAVVGFLRGWSGPVSSAVAEVATLGGWLPQAEEKALINMGSLDQDDLDLLGLNSSPSKSDSAKDKTLIAYARSLTQRGEMKSSGRPPVIREGWEIAVAVLGRLDSVERSEEMIAEFLQGFSLNDSSTVDKLWKLLSDIGLGRQAERIAESYADQLAEASHKYGEALWYYALSHKTQKVKDVLDLLISFSLIQSIAYPPEADLDGHLRKLVFSPKSSLTEISQMDTEAAELLHKMLSGYATLRKFYDLRDEEILSSGNKSRLGPIARKAEAATALIAVITSSDDNIRGGLYDEGRGAVVSVDFLLALLGEAMIFVNQTTYALTVSQINVLLKAIEDLQQVGPRVYTACTEFLQTVVASGQGMKGSTPADLLRKSTSNMSGSSNFSLGGSWMIASQLKDTMSSSGVLVKGNTKRGWDWRKNISAKTSGDDVLRILRHGLAKDLAKAWLLEADSRAGL